MFIKCILEKFIIIFKAQFEICALFNYSITLSRFKLNFQLYFIYENEKPM